jgi:hypothetical protein
VERGHGAKARADVLHHGLRLIGGRAMMLPTVTVAPPVTLLSNSDEVRIHNDAVRPANGAWREQRPIDAIGA